MRIVVVTEVYYNERPQTFGVDIDALAPDNPYRKAVEHALDNNDEATVTYDLFGTRDGGSFDVRGATIEGHVTLEESGNQHFVDPFLPEDFYEDED
jgi:hypothetical protein